MELPPPLRRAVDQALDGMPLAGLAAAADSLSRRYREELHDGGLHLNDDQTVLAYLATRLPATYAAVAASLAAAAIVRPDFTPKTVLDVGAGPGTALWAAAKVWTTLDDALLIEASPAVRSWGERLCAAAAPQRIVWRTQDAAGGLSDCAPRELVTLAYVLGEIAPAERDVVIDRLWQLTSGVFVIVEPGTPAGWQRILNARSRLVAAGACLIAPCAHALACPLAPPDWCHFAKRVPRSRVHRKTKGAALSWEDEKFIYLALSRQPRATPAARVIARPRRRSGRISFKLCQPDGSAEQRLLSRRDGPAFRNARRLDWGDSL
jgi:ribosomal protein RSM22 (predicted rRNA methylase)